jgi:hypothetical protein
MDSDRIAVVLTRSAHDQLLAELTEKALSGDPVLSTVVEAISSGDLSSLAHLPGAVDLLIQLATIGANEVMESAIAGAGSDF